LKLLLSTFPVGPRDTTPASTCQAAARSLIKKRSSRTSETQGMRGGYWQ
jgi:hypothetical protein